MKIRLSMPSTTSMTTRVASASQAAGSDSRTMMCCMAGPIMWPRSASIQPFLSAAKAAKPAADAFVRRARAAHSPSRHRLPVCRGLRVGRQHARHRPAAGAAGRHLPCHGRRGLDRRHRLPVRQRRVRAGAWPVRRSLRHDAGGGHRLHRRGSSAAASVRSRARWPGSPSPASSPASPARRSFRSPSPGSATMSATSAVRRLWRAS